MPRRAKIIIYESPEALRSLQEKYRGTKKFAKLEVLYLLKTGRYKTIIELKNALGLSYSTLQRWLKIYREKTLYPFLKIKAPETKEEQPQNKLIFETLLSTDGKIILYRDFFTQKDNDRLFHELYNDIDWRQDFIKIRGRSLPLPRLTAWYGEPDKSYTYSGIKMNPQAWTPELLYIKEKIEFIAGIKFNSVLLNLYRNGRDSVSWHSDDEPELGQNPVIGSVSFGETRRFMFKHKYRQDLETIKVDLTDGSFLLMRGETQSFWQHQVPKTRKLVRARINLTFRIIQS